jgi:DNA-binding XRE family transcriptional regulator
MNLHSHLDAARRRTTSADVDEITAQLGHRLMTRRLDLGRRQDDVAAAAGITRQCLADIETGRVVASLASYIGACAALDVDPGPFLRLDVDQRTITEHAIAYAGGSKLIRPNDPEFDRQYPVRTWVRNKQLNGGRVYERVVTVVQGWREVPKVHSGE